MSDPFSELNRAIIDCSLCTRLKEWREAVAREKRAAFRDWDYWGKPVPNFGDPKADRLIVGLAPAAHGANRTGRMFTGDRSGDWLYRALHRAGAANQPNSESLDDGLVLRGVLITAVGHCAPPANKLLPVEIVNCRNHFRRTIALRPWKSVLCLGSLAWLETVKQFSAVRPPKFGHGVSHELPKGPTLWASYHPSQQNTFTGKLTEAMLDDVVGQFLT